MTFNLIFNSKGGWSGGGGKESPFLGEGTSLGTDKDFSAEKKLHLKFTTSVP